MDTIAAPVQLSTPANTSGWELAPPAWVETLTGPITSSWQPVAGGGRARLCDGGRFAVASVVVPQVVAASANELRTATATAYRTILSLLRSCQAAFPVRIWNLIPGILDPVDDQPHRYMAFNGGRYEAYLEWLESAQRFSQQVPTASGVGYPGSDLVIHCLIAEQPGQPVENPRQVASYRYSERYGQVPPCFARATRISTASGPQSWLLVGGTASVKGEDTMYGDDLQSQCSETFRNLAALVGAGAEAGNGGDSTGTRQHLAAYRHLRVYYVQQHDLPIISQLAEGSFTGLESIEYLQAELCRPQLLVEIEGVAELPATAE